MTDGSRDFLPDEVRIAQLEKDMAAMFRLLRVCIGCFAVLVAVWTVTFIGRVVL